MRHESSGEERESDVDMKRYTNPGSFRAAFKKKIVPERYQKLIVMQRFALRVCRQIPSAVMKGGVALELRLSRVRTTKDIDFVVSGDPRQTLQMLRRAALVDLGDFLSFVVEPDKAGGTIDTPGMHYRGSRFVIRATFGGRSTPDYRFKLEVVYDKARGFDLLPCSMPEFPQTEAGDLRIYPIPLQIAEKVHAYTDPNIRDDPKHARYRDLIDIGLLAGRCPVKGSILVEDLRTTFERRKQSARRHGFELHDLPPSLPPPPEPWGKLYATYTIKENLPWGSLGDLFTQAQAFLNPVLAYEVESGVWNPEHQEWNR